MYLRHTGYVWSASFSPDGQRIVSASADKTARVWDVGTGESCKRSPATAPPSPAPLQPRRQDS